MKTKESERERSAKYYLAHKEEIKKRVTEYQRTERGKLVHSIAVKKHEQGLRGERPERDFWIDYTHSKQFKTTQQAYLKSEKGKRKRKELKYHRRDLGFHPISLALKVPFDWHHVNKNDVVAISRDIHRAISHICGDGKLEGVVG